MEAANDRFEDIFAMLGPPVFPPSDDDAPLWTLGPDDPGASWRLAHEITAFVHVDCGRGSLYTESYPDLIRDVMLMTAAVAYRAMVYDPSTPADERQVSFYQFVIWQAYCRVEQSKGCRRKITHER